MKGAKVLLVDDEKEFTAVLKERLESRDIIVDTVHNGRDALEKVKEKSFDAIVVDLMMPEIDGIETLKLLREYNSDLQVILLTGHASIEKGIEAVKLGAMDFLEKPAELEKLLGQIREARVKRAELIEKRAEEEVSKIMRSKGW
ncbi:response regulator [candidate division KSB1 bacterium]